ncbi:nucleoredoxin-like [Montipora capricornis]|uniref:nucleoredoxin-like n=1 Tax=Montipora capricornis TaxID=246305 RepID=UPI0035F1BFC8
MEETFFQKLLGDSLVGKEGTVNTVSIGGEGKTVGLYFSAHWCPPCRGFTPKLSEFYKKHHVDKKFEIIFVSSDKKEEEYKHYFEEMPWLALPYSDRSRKDHLSQKFKVSGIPTLVLLDGKDGKEITKEGRGMMLDDPKGDNFPWRPKTLNDILKDVKLVSHERGEKSFDDLKGKFLGLYFSAHWCPPCRGFTPKLIDTYKALQQQEKNFEIVFLSSDRSEEAFNEYFKEMPWLAAPYGDSSSKELSGLFSVQGIPTLILLDENHEVISSNGRAFVSHDPKGEEFPWKLKPLNCLNELTVSTVNEEPCLIYFTDGEDASIKDANDMIGPVAEQLCSKKQSPVIFFYAKSDDTADSLRDFIDLTDEDNVLVILDVPSQKVYTSDDEVLTKEGVLKFVEDFSAGKLTGKQLRG